MKKFDPTKPVQQRNGRSATILRADLNNDHYPIAAMIVNGHGKEEVAQFNSEGRFFADSTYENNMDLINIPEETVYYTNIYISQDGPFLGARFKNIEDCAINRSKHDFTGQILKTVSVDGVFKSSELIKE